MMPPTDPKLRPALERVKPDDMRPGSSEPVLFPEPWKILFGDGEMHNVSVTGRAAAVAGREVVREVVQVEWSARGERWTGWYYTVGAKMIKRW
jgi:hypothetical protein